MIRSSVSGALCFALALTFGASATYVDTASAQAGDRLEEVVVTARKREESLQDIPLSISAFTDAEIEAAGFRDLGDIAQKTSGIFYDPRATFGSAGRSNSNIRIRGAQVASSFANRQSASLFVDGVFALGGINSMPLSDLERVEVIKGPQSAFFGRNTFAGAVNYITKTPNLDEWEGEADLTAGQYEQYDVSLLASGPIIRDKLGFQINARSMNRGNMWTATDGGGLGEETSESVSTVLYWEPTDRLSIKLRHMFLHDEDGPPATAILKGSDYDTCTGRVYPGRFDDDGNPYTIDFTNGRVLGGRTFPAGSPVNYICGQPPGIDSPLVNISQETTLRPAIFGETFLVLDTTQFGLTGPTNPDLLIDLLTKRTLIPGVPFLDHYGLERYNRRTSLNIDYEFENGISVAALLADNRQDLQIITDFDRQDASAWYGQDPQFFDDASFELRFVSNQDRKLRWVGGITWYEQEFITNGGGGLLATGQFIPGISGVFGLPPTSGDEAEVVGVFGAISYDLTDKLTLDAEVRVMTDERTIATAQGSFTEEYDSTVPRIILSYKPNDQTNIYGQYSQGSLPGIVNGLVAICSPDDFLVPYISPITGQPSTDSECKQLAAQGAPSSTEVQELDAFEVGIKRTFADGRASLSAAAYYWEWVGKQSSATVTWVRDADTVEDRDGIPNAFPNTLGVVVSGSSEMYGLDVEGSYVFSDNWSADLALGWVETEWTDFLDRSIIQLTGTSNQKGNEEPIVPNFAGSLTVTYQNQLSGEWDWYSRLDVNYQGDYFGDPENLLEGPSWTLANLRVGFEKDDLRLEFFVRNLTDEDTWKQVGQAVDFSPQPANFDFLAFNGAALIPQDKRTFGVRASIKF
jgi:iron complex outermembrane receptor protein